MDNLGEKFQYVNAKTVRDKYIDSYYRLISSLPNHSPMLDNPHIYFYTSKTSVYCLGIHTQINVNSVVSKKIFQNFSAYYNISPEYFSDVINALFMFLSNVNYTGYSRALAKFKWQCGMVFFPQLDDAGCLSAHGGNVYINTNPTDISERLLLTEDVMKTLVNLNGGKYFASENTKKRLSAEIHNLFGVGNAINKYEINYRDFCLEECAPMSKALFRRKSKFDPALAMDDAIKITKHIPKRPSPALLNFLMQIYSDDRKLLDELAMLSVRLLTYNKPSDCVWIIQGKDHAKIVYLLYKLCDNRCKSSAYDTERKDRDSALIYDDSQKIHMQISGVPTPPQVFAKCGISFFKKLVSGAYKVKESDVYNPHLGMYYKPLVVYVSPLSFSNYKDYLKTIPFYALSFNNVPDIAELSDEDITWLKIFLPAYGMQIAINNEEKVNEDDFLSAALDSFISEFCVKSPLLATPCQKFREDLILYIKSCGIDLKVFKHPTKLTNKISELGKLQTKTVRSQKNRKCFDGIEVNDTKLSEFIHNKTSGNDLLSDFNSYIEKMCSAVYFESE